MRYTAVKVAKIPFSKEFEVEDAAEGFIKAEEDWSTHAGTDWSLGEVTFDPTQLQQAAEIVSAKKKPTREKVWAPSS